MNKLSYKIISRNRKITDSCPDFKIVLDDKETDFCFDVSELEKSEKQNGIFSIILCTCGEMGCGGAFVEVINESDKIIWKRLWNSYENHEPEITTPESKDFALAEGFIANPPFVFDRMEYKKIIKQLLKEKLPEK